MRPVSVSLERGSGSPIFGVLLAGAITLLLSACGGSEENARPDPVDLAQFKQGTQRLDVITAVGKPQWNIQRVGRPCDIYQLYTTGLTAGAKAAMAVGEGLTDVATLGLAEIAWSGVHAGTRPRIHTVTFCYAQPPNEALIDIYDKDPARTSPPTHTVVDNQLYRIPAVLPAPTQASASSVGTPPDMSQAVPATAADAASADTHTVSP